MASMLDLQLDDVPHFGELSLPTLDPEIFWGHIVGWLSGRGTRVLLTEPLSAYEMRTRGLFGQYHFIFAQVEGLGGTPVGHALIGMNGRIVHDPNRTKPKILSVEGFGFLMDMANPHRNAMPLTQGIAG